MLKMDCNNKGKLQKIMLQLYGFLMGQLTSQLEKPRGPPQDLMGGK